MVRYLSLLVLSLILAMAGAASGFALGNEDIGGGDAVFFTDAAPPMVLDYYVGAQLGYFGGLADLAAAMGPAAGEAAEVKVRRVIGRVARFDPQLAANAMAMLATFQASVTYDPSPLAPVPDVNLEVRLGAGETLVQAAVWTRAADGSIRTWSVNAQTWNSLDQVERAGLMLHEIFYVLHDNRVRQTGQRQNARYLRQFIASISSLWLTGCTADEWDSLLAAMGLF